MLHSLAFVAQDGFQRESTLLEELDRALRIDNVTIVRRGGNSRCGRLNRFWFGLGLGLASNISQQNLHLVVLDHLNHGLLGFVHANASVTAMHPESNTAHNE